MTILSAQQTREVDTYTAKKQGISSYQLMCRAGEALVHWILNNIPQQQELVILAGPGNNGGDALVCARLLWKENYTCKVYSLGNKFSADAQLAYDDLVLHTHIRPTHIQSVSDFPQLNPKQVVLDGIFGSGINKAPEGVIAKLINYVNQNSSRIVSIDIASGLTDSNNDESMRKTDAPIIRPTDTLCIQFPFVSQLIPDYYMYTGNLHIIDIKLDTTCLNDDDLTTHLIDKTLVKSIYKKRSRNGHKGTYGHALVFAGSKGKSGAAILCSEAALRSGAGLVTVHSNSETCKAIQIARPEAMTSYDTDENLISQIPNLSAFSSIAAGPGIGTALETQEALFQLLTNQYPMVLDADALNILSKHKDWLSKLPPNTILTPHPKEFERLLGEKAEGVVLLEKLKAFSKEFGVIIVWKSFYTHIALPNGQVFINITGNAGMATAGSGDVLTGIIAGFLAQKYLPHEAAILGVAFHAAAGDFAVETYSLETLIASDIINHLYKAFNQLN